MNTTPTYAPEVPFWKVAFFTACAGGMGWGIRGQFGHENGAMIAGCLVTLTLCFLLARNLPIQHQVRAAALGIIAMGWGGSMSYGETVGLTHDTNLHNLVEGGINWAALRWGMLGLGIKGGIWISFFGLMLGMGLSGTRYTLKEMFVLMFCALGAYYLGINSINHPFEPFPLDSPDRALPFIYFSDHWQWEPISQIKPRYENWGGMLLALILIFIFATWWKKDTLARNMAFWGLLAGGLGFPGGQSVQAYHQLVDGSYTTGIWPYLSMNWWNGMETTFGCIMGSIIGLGFWFNRKKIGAKYTTETLTTPRDRLPIPAEAFLLLLHLTLIGCLEFYYIETIDQLYDLGLVMGLIPIVLIFGGRIGPYMVIFPIILQTIAGKTVRDVVYKQITHEDGTRERIYNEAATLNLPFMEEAIHLPFALGWFLYFILPMSIALFAAIHFYKKHQTVESDSKFAGYALLTMGWIFFSLNFAFWNYPWPWEGWGPFPWQKWFGPSTTSAFFLFAIIMLTVMVIKGLKHEKVEINEL
jgi:hypothetical protein